MHMTLSNPPPSAPRGTSLFAGVVQGDLIHNKNVKKGKTNVSAAGKVGSCSLLALHINSVHKNTPLICFSNYSTVLFI